MANLIGFVAGRCVRYLGLAWAEQAKESTGGGAKLLASARSQQSGTLSGATAGALITVVRNLLHLLLSISSFPPVFSRFGAARSPSPLSRRFFRIGGHRIRSGWLLHVGDQKNMSAAEAQPRWDCGDVFLNVGLPGGFSTRLLALASMATQGLSSESCSSSEEGDEEEEESASQSGSSASRDKVSGRVAVLLLLELNDQQDDSYPQECAVHNDAKLQSSSERFAEALDPRPWFERPTAHQLTWCLHVCIEQESALEAQMFIQLRASSVHVALAPHADWLHRKAHFTKLDHQVVPKKGRFECPHCACASA